MPRTSSKKKSGKKRTVVAGVNDDSTGPPDNEPQAGLPAKDSIIAEESFTSPKGKTYRIIKTTETDAYDKPSRSKRKRR